MKKKKIPFITDVYNSIFNFDYYKDIVNSKTSKCFVYFFILILIYAIAGTVGVSYSISKSMKEIQSFVQTEINVLEYSNGILSVDENSYKTYYNNQIIIDTSGNELAENKNAKAIFEKDKFSILVGNQYIILPYEAFFSGSLSKENVVNLFEFKNYAVMIIVISLIVSYISFGISIILDILVVALIGYILAGIIGNTKISYKNALNISIHAITLPIILAMIYLLLNTFTGFDIKYFSVMYTSISTIYVTTAMILVKMDDKDNS